MTALPKNTRIPSRGKPGTYREGERGFRSLGSLVADLMREAAMRATAAHDELIRAEREMAIRQAVRRFTR